MYSLPAFASIWLGMWPFLFLSSFICPMT
jgi:hypothetical protein